jgi:hypothetical protein
MMRQACPDFTQYTIDNFTRIGKDSSSEDAMRRYLPTQAIASDNARKNAGPKFLSFLGPIPSMPDMS